MRKAWFRLAHTSTLLEEGLLKSIGLQEEDVLLIKIQNDRTKLKEYSGVVGLLNLFDSGAKGYIITCVRAD